jgi:hypothetical protein
MVISTEVSKLCHNPYTYLYASCKFPNQFDPDIMRFDSL